MRKQVTYLGNILCYEIENLNKPVCICFHGMNMTREMYKTDQLQHLLKNYSLVLVDLCGYGAVSYTHLDVYKRQGLGILS